MIIEAITNCYLTGYKLSSPSSFIHDNDTIEYESAALGGKVRLSMELALEFRNDSIMSHPVAAGICRNGNDFGKPSTLTTELIKKRVSSGDIPKNIAEKEIFLLKYMYKKGSDDIEEMDFLSVRDYPVCYAKGSTELEMILQRLYDKNYITWAKCINSSRGKIYRFARLEDLGLAEIKKDLPKIPMIGLLNQEISTGDPKTDEKIMTAKKLFFNDPTNFEEKRSACESLSFILEPLRQKTKKYLTNSDVEAFFTIVNNFDIRHNKDYTKTLIHPEQYEWLFYSLLNTINTYTKLVKRLHKSE
jgi:hypothetical protein